MVGLIKVFSIEIAQIATVSLFAFAFPLSRHCTTGSVIRLVSRQDCCTVRLPDTYSWILIRSDSLLDRFPYEDIGSCLPEEGCQHQVRHPRRKKERVCIIRFTGPREASLTALSAPTPEGRGVTPFNRLYKQQY